MCHGFDVSSYAARTTSVDGIRVSKPGTGSRRTRKTNPLDMEYVLLSQCKSRWTIKTIGSYARICCGRCAGSFLDNNVVAGVAVAHLEVAVVAM